MPVTNDFQLFATGAGANVITQADYLALAAKISGFTAGVATSAQLNKVWRQASIMSAMLGQFINDIGGVDALDDGTVATLLTAFERAFQKGSMNYAVAGGTANALTATLTPAPAAIQPGFPIRLKIQTTNTLAATLDVNGTGALAIMDLLGSAIAPGDLPAGAFMDFIATGTSWMLIGPSLSQVQLASVGQQQAFTAAGVSTFTAPVDGTYYIEVIGGGGGGGAVADVTPVCGGAGGGGGVAEGNVALTKGQTVTVTVGDGGAGGYGAGVSTTTGGTGGTSSFGAYMSATGGGGGLGNGSATLRGGISGIGTGGALNYGLGDGSTGATFYTSSPQLVAPGCGGGPGGQSGAGSGGPGYPGKGPGGGGGGTGNSSPTASVGGVGYQGRVIVRW